MSLECPKCGEPTSVVGSRQGKVGWRCRRDCTACGLRFTTVELPADELAPDFEEMIAKAMKDAPKEVARHIVRELSRGLT